MARIAFIGLGNMGGGMCANLAKAKHDVRAFDLSAEAVSRAVSHGATAAPTIADAVSGVDVVVTMLPAGKHVKGVYLGDDGVSAHAKPGALCIDCSTIAVEDARSVSKDLAAKGFVMVDAPVSGGTAAAEAGTLTFMVGGEKDAFERAKAFLESMGKNIFHAGASGNGQAAKVANNMLLGISMIATSEAFNLAEKLGLDAQTFFDISSKASGQNWSMTSYCPAPGPVPAAPSNKDYKPGAAGASTPLGDLAQKMYVDLDEEGHGGMDFSFVMKRVQGEV